MTILLQKFSVQDTGADDAKKISLYEKLARKGRLVVAVDVRGIGETQPPHHPTNDRSGPYSHLFNAETTMTFMTSYMDESLFGMRAQDVVRAVAYALSRPDSMKMGVRAVGKGAGARWVLYAAALDPRDLKRRCRARPALLS